MLPPTASLSLRSRVQNPPGRSAPLLSPTLRDHPQGSVLGRHWSLYRAVDRRSSQTTSPSPPPNRVPQAGDSPGISRDFRDQPRPGSKQIGSSRQSTSTSWCGPTNKPHQGPSTTTADRGKIDDLLPPFSSISSKGRPGVIDANNRPSPQCNITVVVRYRRRRA